MRSWIFNSFLVQQGAKSEITYALDTAYRNYAMYVRYDMFVVPECLKALFIDTCLIEISVE